MLKKQVFVISPIGKKDSDRYKKFDAVLKTMIKPAIDEIDKEFKIIRADQISQPGSFIKDILEQIQSAYIVIANLTDLNPNVFYELGVRHALSNRTIMITENLAELPSDLKEYRVIEYSAELTAIETFRNDLKKAFIEILENPDKSDNPVQDRLPGIIEKREDALINEIELLNTKLKEKQTGKSVKQEQYIERRINRILNLIGADRASTLYGISWTNGEDDKKKTTIVSKPWGNFKFYFVKRAGTEYVDYSLIISLKEHIFDLEDELSDIRVMIKEYANKGMTFKFVIATNQIMTDKKKKINDFFKKALKLENLSMDKYFIEVWDDTEITKQEKLLGLK